MTKKKRIGFLPGCLLFFIALMFLGYISSQIANIWSPSPKKPKRKSELTRLYKLIDKRDVSFARRKRISCRFEVSYKIKRAQVLPTLKDAFDSIKMGYNDAAVLFFFHKSLSAFPVARYAIWNGKEEIINNIPDPPKYGTLTKDILDLAIKAANNPNTDTRTWPKDQKEAYIKVSEYLSGR